MWGGIELTVGVKKDAKQKQISRLLECIDKERYTEKRNEIIRQNNTWLTKTTVTDITSVTTPRFSLPPLFSPSTFHSVHSSLLAGRKGVKIRQQIMLMAAAKNKENKGGREYEKH